MFLLLCFFLFAFNLRVTLIPFPRNLIIEFCAPISKERHFSWLQKLFLVVTWIKCFFAKISCSQLSWNINSEAIVIVSESIKRFMIFNVNKALLGMNYISLTIPDENWKLFEVYWIFFRSLQLWICRNKFWLNIKHPFIDKFDVNWFIYYWDEFSWKATLGPNYLSRSMPSIKNILLSSE